MTQITIDKATVQLVAHNTDNDNFLSRINIETGTVQMVVSVPGNSDYLARMFIESSTIQMVVRNIFMQPGEIYIDNQNRLCVVGPLAAGTYSATVRVTDTNGATFDKELSFTVDADGGISDGFILLEDGASFLLMEDGASKVQRETGI